MSHLGQVFSHVRSAGFLVRAFFSAANCRRRGASARDAAHWGWMPAREYDDLPQTGHLLGIGSGVSGIGFLQFIRLYISLE
jgi:hypothetical protein